MTSYAYVENETIKDIRGYIPKSWNNISNFHTLSKEELENYGWYEVVPDTRELPEGKIFSYASPSYSFVDGKVYEQRNIVDKQPEVVETKNEEFVTIDNIKYRLFEVDENHPIVKNVITIGYTKYLLMEVFEEEPSEE